MKATAAALAVLFAGLLAAAQPSAPDPEDLPFPLGEQFAALRAKLESLRRSEDRAAQDQVKEELDRLEKGLMEETGAIGKALFTARQSELRRGVRAEVPEGRRLGLTALDWPQQEGSTSTIPLGIVVACRLLGAEYEWSEGRRRAIDDGLPFRILTGDDLLVEWTPRARPSPGRAGRLAAIINGLLVDHRGTHEAWQAIGEGNAEIVLAARPPSADERAFLAGKGVTLDVRPVARDALVFIVNRLNPVRDLRTSQLRDIYSGAITHWSFVGGKDLRISPYQRERNSGSQELMLDLFMKGTRMMDPARNQGRLVRGSMMGPFSALTEDAAGLAYSIWYYEHFMAGSPYTRTIAVDGVRPTAETIRSGAYPYVAEVVVGIRADAPADSPARRLRDWLLSPEGQRIVAESGYVPLPPR